MKKALNKVWRFNKSRQIFFLLTRLGLAKKQRKSAKSSTCRAKSLPTQKSARKADFKNGIPAKREAIFLYGNCFLLNQNCFAKLMPKPCFPIKIRYNVGKCQEVS
ncbi:MAG: hypothetical protein VB108_09490 [Anaerolineaceae bacterium]|nr:hypothetical protein [Anaerolineaceae bacterium]